MDTQHTDSLLEDYESDLLPEGTRVFPSRFHRSPGFWKVVVVGLLVAALLVFIGASTEGAVSLSFVCASLAALVVVNVYAFFANKNEYKDYLRKSLRGAWHEGVVVFSTGDVVVRSAEDIFTRTEVEMDSSTIKSVKEFYSWSILAQLRHLWCSRMLDCCCGAHSASSGRIGNVQGRPYLYLAFEIEDPDTGVVSTRFFSCAALIDDPKDIVAVIKETQKKRRRQSI
jgi:hypothetical protein